MMSGTRSTLALAVATLLLAGCSTLAISTAPAKPASTQRSELAKQADALFWQVLHVFEILKNNVRKNRGFHWSIVLDLLLIAAGAYGIYYSVNFLVDWVSTLESAYVSAKDLGWLSGLLMVVPNAFIALYYGYVGRQDIVVSSQVGDGHICIPMCIGLFALSDQITIPGFFQIGIYVIAGAAVLHFLCIAFLGRLPRALGYVLVAAYGVFVYTGVVQQ